MCGRGVRVVGYVLPPVVLFFYSVVWEEEKEEERDAISFIANVFGLCE